MVKLQCLLREMAFIYSSCCFEWKKAVFLGISFGLCAFKPKVASKKLVSKMGMKNSFCVAI